jgi:hypothetical protein
MRLLKRWRQWKWANGGTGQEIPPESLRLAEIARRFTLGKKGALRFGRGDMPSTAKGKDAATETINKFMEKINA